MLRLLPRGGGLRLASSAALPTLRPSHTWAAIQSHAYVAARAPGVQWRSAGARDRRFLHSSSLIRSFDAPKPPAPVTSAAPGLAPAAPSNSPDAAQPVAAAASAPLPPSASEGGPFVRRLNRALVEAPVETLLSLIALEGASFFITKGLLTAAGVQVPALFAAAYVLSVPLRKGVAPKLALSAPLAAMLARAVPQLTQVQLGKAFATIEWPWGAKARERRAAEKAAREAVNAGVAAPASAPTPLPPTSPPAAPAPPSRFRALALELSDKYGLALLISYRLSGFLLTVSCYLLLSQGVDLAPLLVATGMQPGSLAGSSVVADVAAAVTLAALWFPVTVFIAPFPALAIRRVRLAASKYVQAKRKRTAGS